MTRIGGSPTFRLLDRYVGWDASSWIGLDGIGPDGFPAGEALTLALERAGEIDERLLLAAIPPPRLARGCGPCAWYLVTPSGRLLLRGPCPSSGARGARAFAVASAPCDPIVPLVAPGAIAVRGRTIAISDPGAGLVWVLDHGGTHVQARIRVQHPGPVAITPWGELLVALAMEPSLLRFNLGGEPRGRVATPGLVERMAVGDVLATEDGRLAEPGTPGAQPTAGLWIVTRRAGALRLDRASWLDLDRILPASAEDLAAVFPPTQISAASAEGFCLEERDGDGNPARRCFSWEGEPLDHAIEPPAPPARARQGQLLTSAIDSGVPRCRWHRVRVTADVPPGAGLLLSVATSETATEPDPTAMSAERGWTDFPAGSPHALDWQTAPGRATDFLIQQPPGRYLFLRLRLTGDGAVTPVVRRVRLDLPRVTSLERLPAVYRESPEAEDFTERFLSLFDATLADLDRAIERGSALLDPDGVPDELLPWLGRFLDLAFEPQWSPEVRRDLIRAAPELFRRRGTPAGLAMAVRLVAGVDPAIQEEWAERRWAAVSHDARLGEVRLFSAARARFRVGRSSVGRAPLRSYGDPAQDPFRGGAFRFSVLVPPSRLDRERLLRLIASLKPAHTVASVREGGGGYVLGRSSAVGVDTQLGGLPPPILGRDGNLRLSRMSVLWPGPRGRASGLRVGRAEVGIQTVIR